MTSASFFLEAHPTGLVLKLPALPRVGENVSFNSAFCAGIVALKPFKIYRVQQVLWRYRARETAADVILSEAV
jgi:hypothetical protein